MTRKQAEALETIREHGGYACLRWGMHPRWLCAYLGEHAYRYGEPVLSTRVMEALREAGHLQRAPGPGYGCCSFWEPTPPREEAE